jgi:hypothetical protein
LNKKTIFINDKDSYNAYYDFKTSTYFENSLKYIETFIFESIQSIDYYNNIKEYDRDMKLLNSNSNSNSNNYNRPRTSDITLDDNTIINHVLCHSKNLIHLKIKEKININNINNINCILHNLPNTLKILNLSGIVNMNDELLNIATSHSTQLIKLDISSSHITNSGISYLKRLRNLKICDISFTRITDNYFEILGELPSLKKLNISMCRLITDRGIHILVRKNPDLTHLNMEYTNIGQLAVNHMTTYLKNPVYINMDYTHYAEFINISALKEKCKVLTYRRI